MSVRYLGNTYISEKITKLIAEMLEDTKLCYTINIYESRENEKITKLLIEVANIEEEGT